MNWKPKELHITANERTYGVVITIQHTNGTLHTFHRPGKPTQALKDACKHIDDLGDQWRITCISTPRTIYRDMQGTRDRLDRRGSAHDTGNPFQDDPRTAEFSMLKQIGRLDLLQHNQARTYRQAS